MNNICVILEQHFRALRVQRHIILPHPEHLTRVIVHKDGVEVEKVSVVDGIADGGQRGVEGLHPISHVQAIIAIFYRQQPRYEDRYSREVQGERVDHFNEGAP